MVTASQFAIHWLSHSSVCFDQNCTHANHHDWINLLTPESIGISLTLWDVVHSTSACLWFGSWTRLWSWNCISPQILLHEPNRRPRVWLTSSKQSYVVMFIFLRWWILQASRVKERSWFELHLSYSWICGRGHLLLNYLIYVLKWLAGKEQSISWSCLTQRWLNYWL